MAFVFARWDGGREHGDRVTWLKGILLANSIDFISSYNKSWEEGTPSNFHLPDLLYFEGKKSCIYPVFWKSLNHRPALWTIILAIFRPEMNPEKSWRGEEMHIRPVIEWFPKYRTNTGFFSSKYRIYRQILSQIQDIQDKLREKYCRSCGPYPKHAWCTQISLTRGNWCAPTSPSTSHITKCKPYPRKIFRDAHTYFAVWGD